MERTFGELAVGDRFIIFPAKDDAYIVWNIFEKMNPNLFDNAFRLKDGLKIRMPDMMKVCKIE